MSNSIVNKFNDYLLEKVSRSKVQYLFAVSKKHLFSKVHELSEKNEELEAGKDYLYKTIQQLKRENKALKTQSEGRTDINYKLAYERLTQKYDELRNENKSIKTSVDVVSNVIENTKKQNEQLKDRLKRTEAEKDRLEVENKKYKEKEKVIDIKQENKTIKHNFTVKRNNNSNKNMVITK